MSAKHYVRIGEGEFDEFIAGVVARHEVVDEPGTREKVYELPLPADGLSIRVYSTIQGGVGRDRGADAIRCVVWSDEIDGPVGGRRKTLRISTWRENLREKIEDLYANYRDHVHGACPECGRGVLVERRPSGPQGWDAFLACSEWDGGDGCEHTEPL
jgi:hypothetical protein